MMMPYSTQLRIDVFSRKIREKKSFDCDSLRPIYIGFAVVALNASHYKFNTKVIVNIGHAKFNELKVKYPAMKNEEIFIRF